MIAVVCWVSSGLFMLGGWRGEGEVRGVQDRRRHERELWGAGFNLVEGFSKWVCLCEGIAVGRCIYLVGFVIFLGARWDFGEDVYWRGRNIF